MPDAPAEEGMRDERNDGIASVRAPQAEDEWAHLAFCPNCGKRLYLLKCKARCPHCGFFQDCSDTIV